MDILDQIIQSIDKDAIKTLKTCMQAMKDSAGPLTGNPMYLMQIFRNIVRIGYEKIYDYNDYVSLIKRLQRSKIPEDIIERKSHKAVKIAYDYIVTKILKEKLK
jgi:hypothetical protein